MTEVITPDIEAQILERLRNADDPDAIITSLCEAFNLNWPEASVIVERIRKKHQNQILLAQSPILTLIALVLFIGGVALCVQAIGGVLITYKAFNSFPETSATPINLVGFLIYLISYAPALFAFFILGLGMIIGSMRGMQDIWTALFQKAGLFSDPGGDE